MRKLFWTNQPGQVALVMVLIMTVVSALAVSIASRSTVETRVQELNVENTQALLTAQAGLEDAISKNTAVTGTLGPGKDYSVSVGDTGANSITTEKVNSGETFEVNLEGANGVDGISVYWKAAVAGETPSLFITDIRTDANTDYAYDTVGAYGFTKISSGGSLDGISYNYVTPIIPVGVTSTKLRITVLGASAFIGIQPSGGNLPPQATEYKAVGGLTSEQKTVKYGIEYSESKTDQLPSVFDYVLFSGATIE